jgi:hypothetical protein
VVAKLQNSRNFFHMDGLLSSANVLYEASWILIRAQAYLPASPFMWRFHLVDDDRQELVQHLYIKHRNRGSLPYIRICKFLFDLTCVDKIGMISESRKLASRSLEEQCTFSSWFSSVRASLVRTRSRLETSSCSLVMPPKHTALDHTGSTS